jgi:hypothetical protein
MEYSEFCWLNGSELFGEWVWGPLRFSPCALLLLEAGDRGMAIVQEPRVGVMSAFESRYQATTGEATADWEDLMRAVVSYRECALAIEL